MRKIFQCLSVAILFLSFGFIPKTHALTLEDSDWKMIYVTSKDESVLSYTSTSQEKTYALKPGQKVELTAFGGIGDSLPCIMNLTLQEGTAAFFISQNNAGCSKLTLKVLDDSDAVVLEENLIVISTVSLEHTDQSTLNFVSLKQPPEASINIGTAQVNFQGTLSIEDQKNTPTTPVTPPPATDTGGDTEGAVTGGDTTTGGTTTGGTTGTTEEDLTVGGGACQLQAQLSETSAFNLSLAAFAGLGVLAFAGKRRLARREKK